jgi:hypothetical protein
VQRGVLDLTGLVRHVYRTEDRLNSLAEQITFPQPMLRVLT